MGAIYKRELAGYFKSMIGYVFMFFVFLVVGIYFNAYNLSYAYPTIGVTLNSITFVFLIAVPIITSQYSIFVRRFLYKHYFRHLQIL